MDEYDISIMFDEIEMTLLKKLKKRMEKGIKKEKIANMTDADWNLWQVESLKGIAGFRQENKKWLKDKNKEVNEIIEELLRNEYRNGMNEEEKQILEMIKMGVEIEKKSPLKESFFLVNNKKIDALCEEILGKFETVENSILRQSEDIYKNIIKNAQLYRATGAATTWDAVDLATSNFTKNGIFYATYKDGKNVNIASYSEMAIRTGNLRANNIGKARVREEHGSHLVMVSAYGMCSKLCLPWQGRIYCDDVNNSPTEEEKAKYPLLSEAIAGGLFHPNCRHGTTIYLEDSGQELPKLDKSSEEITKDYENEQEQHYNERQIRKWKKNEELSLTDNRKAQCRLKVQEWQKRNKEFCKDNNLRRDYSREKVRV